MTDPVTHTLKKPISFNGETFTDLTFNEPTAGDACRADLVEGEMQKSLAIMAGMADVDIAVLQKIPLREFTELAKKVAPLMGELPADGSTPSP